MSSILGFSGHANTDPKNWTKEKMLKLADKFVDKGDYQDLYTHSDETGLIYLVHNRLVTVGLETETFSSKDDLAIAFDGKILNYAEFDDVFQEKDTVSYDSDTSYEFILYVYRNLIQISENGSVPEEFEIDPDAGETSSEEKNLVQIMNDLADGTIDLVTAFKFFFLNVVGDYAFVLHDITRQKTLMCRGGIGLTPLYYGITQLGEFMMSSEKKTLIEDCVIVIPFPPNSYIYDKISGNIPTIHQIQPHLWNPPDDSVISSIAFESGQATRKTFAIDDLLQTEIDRNLSVNKLPYGVIVDETLQSKIMVKVMHSYSRDLYNQWGKRLHTFSVHLEGYSLHDSTQEILDQIDSIHYCYEYTVAQAWAILPQLIYILESTDLDLVLRSLPLYFLLLKIKNVFHLKTVYHSLGPELFQNFTDREDSQKVLQGMSEKYGALTNKLPSAHEMEFELPLMAPEILNLLYPLSDEYWNNTDASEDFHLFRTFARRLNFNDTAGETEKAAEKATLKTGLEALANGLVTDQEFGTGLLIFAANPPSSKLDYYFRKIYLGHFGNK